METTTVPVTTAAVGLRYGLLTGLVSILFSFALFATDQQGNSAIGLLGFVILIAGIVLAHRAFKQANAGYLAYGQGVGIGTMLAAVSGVLSTAFSYVYREFIDPDMSARVLDQARAKLEAAGTMSEAQINQALSMSTKFTTGPIGLVFGVVGSILFGVIFSLVIAAITKNPEPEFE
ncbi:MAG: DUF4199 domain-containing protein [Janthinobacterium lividum]